MSNIIVAPSILSADFANLERDIKKIENAGADWVHIDVMDGRFVPNITIGAPVVKSIRKTTDMIFDVHLMIFEPVKHVEDFAKAGADIITVHEEACRDNLQETVDAIKKLGKKAGLSIKPKTEVEKLLPVIKNLDLILVMTVEPGFGGQAFIEDCLPKIRKIKNIITENNFKIDVEVDGGINAQTAKLSVEAGANTLVAGSYVYNSNNIKQAIDSLK